MNRIVSIIITELTSDILKYEEEMELAINSKEDINTKISKIKTNLGKIVQTELMIEKWKNYTSNDNNK
jgi:hypothetical protein